MGQTTAPTRIEPHELVQQRDERNRLGSLHAARHVPAIDTEGPVPLLEAPIVWIWRTACGADLLDTERTPVHVFARAEVQAELERPGARICRRCDRVGAAL